MALPLITVNIIDTKDENEAIRQLAAAVVASAFNDYMVHNMHRYYVSQLRVIRETLYEAAISENEIRDELLNRALELMRSSFFRRAKNMGRLIMRYGLFPVSDLLDLLDGIICDEERREYSHSQIELDRIYRFFHSPLYGLYSGNRVELDKALERCKEEINKERERIR